MAESRWFSAVLLFQSQVGPGWDDEPNVDHQVRIVHAPTPEAAYQRAIALGHEHQHSYPNAAGERVEWQFLGLGEFTELVDAPEDGSEVFSWLTKERGESLVLEKHQLAAFVERANRHRRAKDILNE